MRQKDKFIKSMDTWGVDCVRENGRIRGIKKGLPPESQKKTMASE